MPGDGWDKRRKSKVETTKPGMGIPSRKTEDNADALDADSISLDHPNRRHREQAIIYLDPPSR